MAHQFSRYLRVREKEGWVAVFHELHPDPAYCRTAVWQKFRSSLPEDTALFVRLAARRLVVRSSAEDDEEFARVASTLEHKLDQPTILYLMLAQGCNFACAYCPIPGLASRYGETLLSPEDARAGIHLWSEHLKDAEPEGSYYVIFYGGEPLLNKPVLATALSDIRELRSSGHLPVRNLNLMIATNGVLIDDETVSLFREHDMMVAVGLDGPKSANDSFRRYTDGRGTFDDIVPKIKLLVANGVRTFVSACITLENVRMISVFAPFLKGLGIEKFGFNFLKGKALAELIPAGRRTEYEQQVVAGVMSTFAKDTGPQLEYQAEKKTLAFRNRDFFPADCTCYGNQLVIQPDGQISNCPFFRADLGHVRSVGADFRIARTPIVAEWRKRLPLYHEAYKTSDSKALCGPGCAWGSYDLSGNVLAADTTPKLFGEEVFNELIWSEFGTNPDPE